MAKPTLTAEQAALVTEYDAASAEYESLQRQYNAITLDEHGRVRIPPDPATVAKLASLRAAMSAAREREKAANLALRAQGVDLMDY